MKAPSVRILLAAALGIALAACGGSAGASAPTASATKTARSTPAPTPTATPIDVGEAFLASTAAMERMSAVISGTMTVGEAEGTVSGEMAADANGWAQSFSVEFPGQPPQVQEQVTFDGETYRLRPDGLWIHEVSDGTGAADTIVASALERTDSLDVVGSDDWDGREVVVLEPEDGIELAPSDVGIGAQGTSNFTGVLQFFADPDGTPAGIGVVASWNQATGNAMAPVAYEMRLEFTKPSATMKVAAPSDPWLMHESAEYGYRLAYPEGWDVSHEDETAEFSAYDLFLGPVHEEVFVYHYPDLGADILENAWLRDSAMVLEEDYGVAPRVVEDFALPDGSTVRLLDFHFTDEFGDESYIVEAVVFAGTQAWDLDWWSEPGDEEADLARFRQLVMTFEPIAPAP